MKGILKIIRYVSPYKGLVLLNVLFNVLSAIFGLVSITLIIPFLGFLFAPSVPISSKPDFAFNIKSLSDTFMYHLQTIVAERGQEGALAYICILVVVAFFLKNIFRYLGMYFMVPVRTGIIADLRNAMYRHILILPLSYFSNERKGDLMSRMSNDAKEVEVSVMFTLEALFKEPISIIISLIALIWISPVLTFTVLLLLPVIGYLLSRVNKKLRTQTQYGLKRLDDLIALFDETLGGARIIKAFSAQAFFFNRFQKQNALFTRIYNRGNRLLDAASPLSETVSVALLSLLLYLGGKTVLSQSSDLTAESFIGFIAIFSQIIPPVSAFSSAFSKAQKGLVSINRIEEVLQSEEVITEINNPKSIQHFNHCIELKNVSFSYNNEPVLKNINLKIEKGKTVALVGPSGAGKSTLTDLIPRFYDPTQGQVLIDGIDIREHKILELRKLMGIVTQESILFNDSIYNNIAFGQQGILQEQIEQAAKTANAHEFIVQTENGYQTNIGDRGNKLSGGQKQRISIARAVNTNPDILILDEATSALDTTSERLVQEALSNIMKGRTTVVIAHRLSTIQNADLIVVMNKGEIVEQGTHNELIQKGGLYKELNEMQRLIEN